MGTAEEDGAIRMIPLTHEFLAAWIGTSREAVTTHMNRLRRQGYVRYSRKAMILYTSSLRESLRNEMNKCISHASRADVQCDVRVPRARLPERFHQIRPLEWERPPRH
jgi:hypothetical protein